MTPAKHEPYTLRVQVLSNGQPHGDPITVTGRLAWALENLIKAGSDGCTPVSHPAMRWASYVHKLRGAGFAIETQHESHGGPFPGAHARYVARTELQILPNKQVHA
ncbi:hypothetical protein [Rhizobium sp. BK251]|uniref:winged helix domain-containing protein n=1 Tax=Rhizobium sp. BK251 TaxID=2512125 RepID=UPI00104710C1|nr:hypothetical protein [Rhizobium sp. BK251]TCL70562.1 hypothetical protein EV286_107437 [Rhizobium sp. BK251]